MKQAKIKLFRASIELGRELEKAADWANAFCEKWLNATPEVPPRRRLLIQSTVWPDGRRVNY